LAAVKEEFGCTNVTVDWFHVVQLSTRAVDAVRKQEQKANNLPEATRWAVLKGSGLTEKQAQALDESKNGDFFTAIAWQIKEKLRRIRDVKTERATLWRMTHFLHHAYAILTDTPKLAVIRNALKTFATHPPAAYPATRAFNSIPMPT
jgi:Asp-tRNA(Asn)/Glu-tRNA(Gln) amidotransferase B subunit